MGRGQLDDRGVKIMRITFDKAAYQRVVYLINIFVTYGQRNAVILRLTKIIRSGITFVSRNLC